MANYLLLYQHPKYDYVCWAICQPGSLGLSDQDAIAAVGATIDKATGMSNTAYRAVAPSTVNVIDPKYRECYDFNGSTIVLNKIKAAKKDTEEGP